MKAIQSLALVAAGAGLATAGLWLWQSRSSVDVDDQPTAQAAAERDPLALDAGQRARLGIVTGVLTPAQNQAGVAAFARALDVGPLAAIDSEILTARAAATASAAEAARLGDLARQDQSASARSVQAAAAQATADQQRVALAERRVALEFGPGLARLDTRARAALIVDIAGRRAALLRIDIPGDLRDGGAIRVGDPPVQVTVLGAASATDTRVQGASLLAILRGPSVNDAAAGRLLPARVAGGARESGTIVPKSAVIRANGRLWVFVPKGDSFERRAIDGARPVDNGWFVASGVKPGDTIVTAGAGALRGIETGPAPAEAD